MVLAGWVLPNNPDDKVAIIVRNGEKHTEHEPNKERPDVIEKVLKPRFPNHRDSKVGFALPIEPTDKFGVSVRINHSEFPWFEVKFQNRGTSTIEDMAKNLAENKQEFLYYDNYAKGEIGEIHKWFKNQDIEKISEFWKIKINEKYLELEHPEIPKIKTRARISFRVDWANYIIFTDEEGQNSWAALQVLNIIDVIITPNNLFSFKHRFEGLAISKNSILEASKKMISSKANKFEESVFRGFILNNKRPFHFIYDQLKWAFYISKKASPKKIPISKNGENIFFTLDFIDHEKPSDDSILAYPTILERNSIISSDSVVAKKTPNTEILKIDRKITKDFESAIYDHAKKLGLPELPNASLTLWIGITYENRCWIQQAEGYSAIINQLSLYYGKITVLVDGMTSTHGSRKTFHTDECIIKDIALKTRESNPTIISLSGVDYISKIKFAEQADFFISDAGTSSFIPLRICKKPGVLHSNNRIFTFPDDYSENIKIVDEAYITIDQESQNKIHIIHSNYNIHWQHIYNLISKVIYETRSFKLHELPAPSTPPRENYKAFKTINSKLSSSQQPEEILYNLAALFKEAQDAETGYRIIIRALKHAPSNPNILKEEKKYREELGIKIYKENLLKLEEL